MEYYLDSVDKENFETWNRILYLIKLLFKSEGKINILVGI